MFVDKINLIYFSATHTTQKVIRAIAKGTGLPAVEYNFTHLKTAPPAPLFCGNELAVIGLPVYAGRIPEAALNYIKSLKADGTPCVLLALYGNRAFDDFLAELEDISKEQGFIPVAAAAFIGEHSITKQLGNGRPNKEDLICAEEFGKNIIDKISNATALPALVMGTIPGNRPYRTYSASKSKKVSTEKIPNGPSVDDTCTNCKACVNVCPIDNINPDNVHEIDPYECLRCHACVRVCPVGAIQFKKPQFLRHIKDLEDNFSKPAKEPVIIL